MKKLVKALIVSALLSITATAYADPSLNFIDLTIDMVNKCVREGDIKKEQAAKFKESLAGIREEYAKKLTDGKGNVSKADRKRLTDQADVIAKQLPKTCAR